MNRTDLLNHLIKRHRLKYYLEIGVQNKSQNFDKIVCESKIGVDPDINADATFSLTSDNFFKMILSIESDKVVVPLLKNKKAIYTNSDDDLIKLLGNPFEPPKFDSFEFDTTFDLIFIDGLHTAEQVKKDFENSLKILSPNGFIVLHDCNPEKEEHTIVPRPTKTGHWNGDVYRFAISLATSPNYFTVDIDNGCGVFKACSALLVDEDIDWNYFNKHRKELLNLISWDEFIKL